MIRLEIFVVLANCSLNEFLVGSCIKGKHLFVPNLKSFCKLKIFFSSNFKLTENLLATVNYDCFNKFLGFFLFFFLGGGGGGGGEVNRLACNYKPELLTNKLLRTVVTRSPFSRIAFKTSSYSVSLIAKI